MPQIATFTGYSLKDVESILDAHYLGRDAKLAEAAISKREQNCKTACKMAATPANLKQLSR
ncbi:MAG TPA: hypothetical protein VGC86_13600 [Afipia sp.]